MLLWFSVYHGTLKLQVEQNDDFTEYCMAGNFGKTALINFAIKFGNLIAQRHR